MNPLNPPKTVRNTNLCALIISFGRLRRPWPPLPPSSPPTKPPKNSPPNGGEFCPRSPYQACFSLVFSSWRRRRKFCTFHTRFHDFHLILGKFWTQIRPNKVQKLQMIPVSHGSKWPTQIRKIVRQEEDRFAWNSPEAVSPRLAQILNTTSSSTFLGQVKFSESCYCTFVS